jgi:hypothetical protein
MNPNLSSPTILPAAWEDVLDKVQQALQNAVEQATAGESNALSRSVQADAALEQDAAWQAGLAQVEARLQALAHAFQRAGHRASETDDRLAAGEEALKEWLGAVEARKQSLADWVNGEV